MRVTALIPAFNEEDTIANIVKVLRSHDKINEVLVVNDGSSDNTASEAKNSGARLISLDYNQGKGAALQSGIDQIESDIVLMLDGDLIGLKDKHIDNLLKPIYNNECDMTLGVFSDGRGITDLAQFVSPNLSGQRAVKKDIISDIYNLKDSGYGVEVAINKYVKKHGRLKYVDLEELTHVMKEEKRGLAKGIVDRGKMYWDIIKMYLKKTGS
ncbi:glycosyltransferase family 2 protein [Natronospora cellulosivora (SeqCode)]